MHSLNKVFSCSNFEHTEQIQQEEIKAIDELIIKVEIVAIADANKHALKISKIMTLLMAVGTRLQLVKVIFLYSF